MTYFLKFLLLALVLALPALGATKAVKPKPAPVPPLPGPSPLSMEPGYFLSVDLDPKYQIVGKGELTPEAAAQADCYRLIYNQESRLKLVEYRRAGKLMLDPLFGLASIDFEYQTGIERRRFHPAPGGKLDGVQGEELTLNPAGYPTDVANLNATGGKTRDSNGVIHYSRTLDDHNRVASAKRFGLLNTAITDNEGYFESRTIYDNEGRAIERGNYSASGNLLNDNDGVAVTRTTYTLFPDSMQVIESYFDASGPAVEDRSIGAHEIQRSYDLNGLRTSEAYFDTSGAPCLDFRSNVHERRFTFDDRGNELSESFFGLDGKPKDQQDPDYAQVVYKYDAQNRVVETAYFGDDGAPQVLLGLNAAIIRQEYDDQGLITRQQFFDGQGHPSPCKLYNAPAIRIKVEKGTTIITLRDADDQPMKNPVAGYYAMSYQSSDYRPLALTNKYYNRQGKAMSLLRIRIINPHLYALKSTPVMRKSARYGAAAAGLGALLCMYVALRKAYHTRRRKVYIPTAIGRFMGWLGVFAILEGSLRFLITVYWWFLDHRNGRMSSGVYVLEAVFIVFFIYRLFRFRVTMRVLNIKREDLQRLVLDFFAKARLKAEWVAERNAYLTPPLDVRINFFEAKYHAYLAFRSRGREGKSLARALSQYLRAHVKEVEGPMRSRTIQFYYRCVALCYFLLAGLAFYTLLQVLQGVAG